MSKPRVDQPVGYENLAITDFSAGLNTLYDPRQLAPNNPQVIEAAESPYMTNVDIIQKGAIVTSAGFDNVVTGLAAGPIKGIFTYLKDDTTKQLLFFTGLNVLYITAASSSPVVAVPFSPEPNYVSMVSYVGNTGVKLAILGTDNNILKLWDGTNTSNIGAAPVMSYIMESFKGHLWLAKGKVLYYSATNDQNTWNDPGNNGDSGTISFDDDITGVVAQDEFLVVYTRYRAYPVQFTVTTDNSGNQFAIPSKHPNRNTAGSLAPKTCVPVYNDVYAFSTDGIQRFGADAQFINSSFRVNSLSWKINPTLLPQNYNATNIDKSAAIYFQKKFYNIIPYGNNNYNSQTFVYNYDYNAWTARNGILASNFAIFPDAEGRDELYFGNALNSEVNKFNLNYDYNLFGYNRVYRTKIFNMGNGMRSKNWQWIDLKGAIYLNTRFYVDLTVDNYTQTYYIDNTTLDQSSTGGYYGDNYYGDQYYGGDNNNSNFLRFGARLPFPIPIRSGRELQITIRNQEVGQPWKIDYMNIVYQWDDISKVPYNYQSAVLTNLN